MAGSHPHLRLVYSRSESERIIMSVPDDPEPTISGEWRHGTLDDFCDDLMRMAKEFFESEPPPSDEP